MTFDQRQRQLDYETREAAGESLLSETIDTRVRVRIQMLLDLLGQSVADIDSYSSRDAIGTDVCKWLAFRSGHLVPGGRQHAWSSTLKYILECPTEILLSVLDLFAEFVPHGLAEGFEETLNDIFRQERIAYEMIGLEIVPIRDQHMHAEVVAPTLRLLSGRPGWDEVERAFRGALEQMAIDPANAITDAGTALQQALIAVGMKGNTIGLLAKDAAKNGVLAPHDTTLNEAIGQIMHWVSADRSTSGDGHNAKPASPADAWLIIHIVGALILRLADGTNRDQSR